MYKSNLWKRVQSEKEMTLTQNKVRRTVVINRAIDQKIREIQSKLIQYNKKSVSYSQIVDLLLTMSIDDKTTLDTLQSWFDLKRKKKK